MPESRACGTVRRSRRGARAYMVRMRGGPSGLALQLAEQRHNDGHSNRIAMDGMRGGLVLKL